MCQTIIMICVMALLLCVKTSAFGIHSRQKRVDATGNSARVRATLKESFTDLFGGGSKTTKDLKTGAVDCEKDPLAMDCVVEEIEEKSSFLDSKYVDVNSNSTLKAEILRLEAERDNLMFAKSRIEIRKKKLENIDTMLQKLVNNQIRFDDVLDMKSEPVLDKDVVLRMIELASFEKKENRKEEKTATEQEIETVTKTETEVETWKFIEYVDRVMSSNDPKVAKVAGEVRKIALKR